MVRDARRRAPHHHEGPHPEERPLVRVSKDEAIEVEIALSWFLHQQLGSIFGRERLGALYALGPLFAAELWRWCGAAVDGIADRQEEPLLSRRQAHAEQTRRLVRHVFERMRRVGGDVHGRTGVRSPWFTPKGELDLAVQDREHLLEVVAV